MKLAISGKGGVGKTTLAAGLARYYAAKGLRVLAVDADPDANLADALGYRGEITPLSDMKDLIAQRTGGQSGTYGVFVKLNPEVSDLPEKLTVDAAGVRLLTLGGVRRGGAGCACPENILLKSLLSHLILRTDDLIIADMEAGIEHLGRGTVQAVDALIIVVEPSHRSVGTALRIRELASQIGLGKVFIVGNKIRGPQDREFIQRQLQGFQILGFISYNEMIRQLDCSGQGITLDDPTFSEEVGTIAAGLDRIANPATSSRG